MVSHIYIYHVYIYRLNTGGGAAVQAVDPGRTT
jgi:hypothetical protein